MRQLKITQSITNREEKSLEKYLQEINKVNLISADEEVELSIQIKNGDKLALDRLTRANLRFVVSVAKQYQHQGLSLPDLINEGNIGLIKAAQNFDHSRGFKFISYGVWWIRQSIIQAIAEKSRLIRLPVNKVGLSNRIQKTTTVLEQQLERAPSVEELSEFMNVEFSEVADGITSRGTHVSLDSPFSEDSEGTLIDTIENTGTPQTDRAIQYTRSLKKEIHRALETLTSHQRFTICHLFGIGVERALTLEEIGEKLDVSRERIRQIKNKAIQKLQSSKNCSMLRDYLG